MNYIIRRIRAEDNLGMKKVIQQTMTEFGAVGPGYSINDPEVSQMFETYESERHCYFVVTDGLSIFGGAGIAPLAGSDKEVCELRKMYFMPELRGVGLGQKLMDVCFDAARELGFTKCYLETLNSMASAEKLYLRNGFLPIESPMGCTGHFSCDRFYLKVL